MSAIKKITGTGIPLLMNDIDTDRIIPARFLRCITFDGLGEHVFRDDRVQDADHPFDQEHYQSARILVAGRNFGCGSSREHAPQALMRWGIEAIIAESYAEIFFGNCTSLGIPAVCAARDVLEQLAGAVKVDPTLEITVDLQKQQIKWAEHTATLEIPASAHSALLSGQWDFLTQLLQGKAEIEAAAEKIPYLNHYAV